MNHPHPECTLERVRELEATIAAVRAVACAWDSAEGTYNPAARITRIREILRASPIPPPAAEPVTELEAEVARLREELKDQAQTWAVACEEREHAEERLCDERAAHEQTRAELERARESATFVTNGMRLELEAAEARVHELEAMVAEHVRGTLLAAVDDHVSMRGTAGRTVANTRTATLFLRRAEAAESALASARAIVWKAIQAHPIAFPVDACQAVRELYELLSAHPATGAEKGAGT